MGHVFICLSSKPRDDLQEVLVRYLFWGSIRVGVEGKRKPPVCVAPGYNSPACAHLGKNPWRMLAVEDLEKVSLTLSSSESREGGRVQVGCLHSPRSKVLTAEHMPQGLKHSPLLAKFKVPLRDLTC